MMKKLLGALALVFLAVSAAAETDFELTALDGEPVRLSDYRGQWVVVNYWATWCKPCRKEIPDLSDLHDRRSDLTVLGLAFEDTDPADFETFLEAYPASYPILVVDVYEPPADLGAPRVLPTTHLVDAEGGVVETWLGPVTSEMIESFIQSQEESADDA
jgi:thiol-disulfide isomerase/thioredoxin